MERTALHWIDHALIGVLVVVLPGYAMIKFANLRRALDAGRSGARRAAYVETIVVQWSLAALVLSSWMLLERDGALIGLIPRYGLGLWIALPIAGALAVYLLRQILLLPRATLASFDHVRPVLEQLRWLLPATRAERRWFVGVSITAGICEELLYRGYLSWYLAHFVPGWLAVTLAVLVFGAAHAYQGIENALRCTLVGAAGMALYLASGSLYLSMLLHALVDVQGGATGMRFLELERAPGPARDESSEQGAAQPRR